MRKNKLRNQVLWVGFLTIALTLLALLILPLVSERSHRRETVLHNMMRVWGTPQVIAGPMGSDDGGVIDLTELTIDGELKTSIRKQGIFKFPMYAAKLNFTGKLRHYGAKKILLKSRAQLRIEKASLGRTAIYFNESVDGGIYLYKAVTRHIAEETELNMTIAFEGLQSFGMLPAATTTQVTLKSDWGDPGFFGDFLPVNYEIGKSGFVANWKITQTQTQGRKLNESFALTDERDSDKQQQVSTGVYGVTFYQPVDIYQATERSVKYAILFIALTLMTLLLFEMVSSAEIHPMQYFLAGCGLVIFYLLLLALAEYLGFARAYFIAAVANIALLWRYCNSFLLTRSQSLTFAFVLSLLYSLLYIILQLEEAALLSGSLTLFVGLALTMYLTRKIDWYKVGGSK